VYSNGRSDGGCRRGLCVSMKIVGLITGRGSVREDCSEQGEYHHYNQRSEF
jgi:hypothetical protein